MKLKVRDVDDGSFELVWAGHARGTLRWYDAPTEAIDQVGWWLEIPGRAPQMMMSTSETGGGMRRTRVATQQTAIVLAQATVGELVMDEHQARRTGGRRRRGRLS